MKKLLLLSFLTTLLSCSNDEPTNFDDLVSDVILTGVQNFIADGSSKIQGEINFNPDASITDIDAKIILTNATFENSTESTLSLTPEILPNGRVRAEFTIVSTTRAGDYSIEVNINQYRRKFNLEAGVSSPEAISLTKSANSVEVNFVGEVTFEGTLKNFENRKVSQGVKVRFSDFLSNGNPAEGIYRAESLISNSDSKVSVVYSPGVITPNQFITIIVEILDENNNSIGISSSTEIFGLNN